MVKTQSDIVDLGGTILHGLKGSALDKAVKQYGSIELAHYHMMAELAGDDVSRQDIMNARPDAFDYADTTKGKSAKPPPTFTEQMDSFRESSSKQWKKIRKSRYFKPAAITLGALAGLEVVKSIFGSDPAQPVQNQAPLPAPPLMMDPMDGAWQADMMPNTNLARIERVEGARTTLNISGSADSDTDFRGVSSAVLGNFAYNPVQNGTFRDARAGEPSRRDMQQYIASRMNAAF
jgi:hypothetical protein